MRTVAALLLLLVSAAVSPASAQYGDYGSVTCRISPEASVYTGGSRDCGTRQIGPDGTCYCPSSAGPIPGQIVSTPRRPYYGRRYGEGQSMRCWVSPEASRYTGGSRDCDVWDVGPNGSCSCPSAIGPIAGQIVSARRVPVQVCRVSPEASRYTGGSRDCDLRRIGRDGTCYCPTSRPL